MNKLRRFASREEAGRALASRLMAMALADLGDTVVLALPNGGVPVGAEVARVLKIPFDVLLVGRITTAKCGNAALGAITGGGVRMLNCEMIDRLHLSDAEINAAILRESLELARRERLYRGHHPSLMVADHTVILVDDGTTQCETIRNAIRLLRRQHVVRIIVALPTACRHAACDLRLEADEVATLTEASSPVHAERYFKHFPPPTDSEVRRLLSAKHTEFGTAN